MAKLKQPNGEENQSEESVVIEVVEPIIGSTEGVINKDSLIDGPKVEEATEEVVIPKHIDKILKIFTNLEQMYISKYGGVFPVETDESLTKGCTLYKNPYFNN